jgi:UDP-N-acetylmuramyl pentapeptide synthase
MGRWRRWQPTVSELARNSLTWQRKLATQLQPDVCLLVKGSRVNRLERLVAGLGAAPILRKAGQ